jgi:transcriptional regulator with XRE-family HTH domain
MEARSAMKRRNIIGSYLAKLRHELGLNQEDMAARLQRHRVDISRQMLANMECGRTQITDLHLIGFLKVFRICLIQLFPLEIRALDEQFAQREKDQLDGPRRRRQ